MGAKAAYELFPGGLKSRLQVRQGSSMCLKGFFTFTQLQLNSPLLGPARLPQKERKKRWAEKQRAAVAKAVAAAARFSQEHSGTLSEEQVRGAGCAQEHRARCLVVALLQLGGGGGGTSA